MLFTVATKAEIRFNVNDSWIPNELKPIIIKRYGYRINKENEIVINSSKTRTQTENLNDCFEKLHDMLNSCAFSFIQDERKTPNNEDSKILDARAPNFFKSLMKDSNGTDLTLNSKIDNTKMAHVEAAERQQESNNGHAHGHSHGSSGKRLIVMLTMTFLFFIVELVFGYFSHSMALIADSFHMLSDVMALGIAYGCMRIATRDTKKNTFGWVRAEVLGALVNGVFLLALCFTIFIESVTRIVEPEMIKEPRTVLIVGVIGLVINLIGMCMFHGHAHGHAHGHEPPTTVEGEASHLIASHQDRAMVLAEMDSPDDIVVPTAPKKQQSGHSGQLNMRGVFLHVLSDAIGSVIVIATALVSWLVPGYDELKLYMDPGLSLFMVGLMVFTTFPLVRETALILLQTTPKYVEVEAIKQKLLKIDGIEAVHEFHVWRLVGERIIATVHIRFRSLRDYLDSAEYIRTVFHENSIHSATIQPEFEEMGAASGCTFTCLPRNCNLSDVKCCKESSNTETNTKTDNSSSELAP
uniref:Zinc transporter 1 n=1 Tax=Panagrolaimus sp. ES5 TaxID=591445 RepID=A0AC34GV11_9BILA